MDVTLSDELKRVLDGRTFVTLTTLQPDGSPQASPVWVARDGEELLVSTTVDRRKYLNLRRDPRVSVVAVDPDMPYRYAEIRGSAAMTTEGGAGLIDELARKYTGKANYAEFNPAHEQDAERVVVRITPRRVAGNL